MMQESSKLGIGIAWVGHIQDREKRKEVAKSVRQALATDPTIARLRHLIGQKADESRAVEVPLDHPNWAIKRAAKDGEIKAFQRVLQLLSYEDE